MHFYNVIFFFYWLEIKIVRKCEKFCLLLNWIGTCTRKETSYCISKEYMILDLIDRLRQFLPSNFFLLSLFIDSQFAMWVGRLRPFFPLFSVYWPNMLLIFPFKFQKDNIFVVKNMLKNNYKFFVQNPNIIFR